jgi:hypothetical protein
VCALFCILVLTSNLHSATAQFRIGIRVLKPSVVNSVQDLSFNESENGALTVKKAAIFNLKGQENRVVTVSVLEETEESKFVVTGPTSFDSKGNANGIKINPVAGAYAMNDSTNTDGELSLRVIYQ